MAIKLEKEYGSIDQIRKLAIVQAVELKDDVIFEFNGTDHTITLTEAKAELPLVINQSLESLEQLKDRFNQDFSFLSKKLSREIEALKQL